MSKSPELPEDEIHEKISFSEFLQILKIVGCSLNDGAEKICGRMNQVLSVTDWKTQNRILQQRRSDLSGMKEYSSREELEEDRLKISKLQENIHGNGYNYEQELAYVQNILDSLAGMKGMPDSGK